MKAAICTAYGPPEVLVIQEVHQPKPKSNELLIQVHASAVHSGDRRLRALDVPALGKLPMRLVVGFKAPRQPILGVVLAGTVVETGNSVKNFQVGDNVYALTGMRFGGYAEFACVNESKCVFQMPAHASFIEAAALPFGGTTALHFLRKARIERATNVLIYGGAGAVGSTAVQIAKHYGVHVTAVCHERNIELVKRLGADVVVDYSREGYDRELGTYDAVFDASGKIDKRLAKTHVAENGAFSSVAGQGPASERKEDLKFLNELFEAGELQPVIDSVYSLDEIVEAHRYVDQGKKVGNVVVKINEESIR
ncbi:MULTISPECIES: NAD(P)-dependent alcohol dehydrogenase [unclassified Exiguobacterium]|uniref:NAD(P)-dependent alcohol dehydrogenase n=1 Tax=unclassified Exiguobacterium TaxID=2644629 RepID=UPI001BECCD9D|nr:MULTISPECIES: NAD(P)-dependent alcohol dehydrogenase [unclassified Exiguobacterium]